ncbi:pancreatic triacylglycerol lipase [Plakobranchus ocellatus]|uniref:Pancreatic triacylglycerol lipase n=1 Tax=Plakobranchus ocellatus TaxID=259542 RepID=A0AAV4BQ10_9GAST|nr:pancreatic triacylglycerol lipase [Plakobranchus ocellatus]
MYSSKALRVENRKVPVCTVLKHSSLDPPFTNTFLLPQSPAEIGTTFELYTRDNRTAAQVLNSQNRSTIENSNFDPTNLTKIIIHGFLQRGSVEFVVDMKNALLDKATMNVIVVAWEGGAQFPYNQAVANTRVVGAQTALLLHRLVEVKSLELSTVHIIGHSLGAHVAGYAGACSPGLGRITGLDPAQPNYHNYSTAVRLDPSDAHFVDVIHTDARPYETVGGYGIIEPIGDIDFYPNGGREQPGCDDETSYLGTLGYFLSHGLSQTEQSISCSHERSTKFFTASIRHSLSQHGSQCRFRAVPCLSYESFLRGECLNCLPDICPIMGLEAPNSRSRGVYYLTTTSTPNFCGFQYFVTLYVSNSSHMIANADLEVTLTGEQGSTGRINVHSGAIDPGSSFMTKDLISNDIGNATEVKVRAIYYNNNVFRLFRTIQHEVTLCKVKVDSVAGFTTRFFCGPNMVLHAGQELTITSYHLQEEDCE